jgi:DEAD/DEAH box helicase domain-containing protein
MEQMDLLAAVTPKPRVLVFDLETLRSAHDVGGWGNLKNMGMACGVVYDSLDEQYHVYLQTQVRELVDHLAKGDLVVGFNHVRFDYAVLSGCSDAPIPNLPNFDILEDVERRLGHRLKLNSLVTATLKESKSADGMQSLQWIKEGKMDLVTEYCKKDVEVTKRLFDYGVKEGRVYYYDRDGESIQMTVDWNPKALVQIANRSKL